MRNLFEENPKMAGALVALCVAGAIGFNFFVKRKQNSQWDGHGGAEQRVNQVHTKRLIQLRQIEFSDPETALTLVESIIRSPENENEAKEAREKHAAILQLCFQKRLQAGQPDQARTFMEQLQKDYPASYLVKSTGRTWSEARKRACLDLLKNARWTETRAILVDLAANDLLFGDGGFLEQCQHELLLRWKHAGGTEHAEFQSLLDAASIVSSLNIQAPVASALKESAIPGLRLLELADAQPVGTDRFRAIPFYQAVLLRLNSDRAPWGAGSQQPGPEERQRTRDLVEIKLAELFLSLARSMQAGTAPVITAENAETVCRDGAQQLQQARLRVPLLQELIRMQEARFHRLSKPALVHSLVDLASKRFESQEHNRLNQTMREAGTLGEEILRRSGAQLWISRVRDTNFNPWPLLTGAVQEEFASRRKKGDSEEYLRQALAARGQNPEFQIPLEELRRSRQTLCELNARRGLLEHAHDPQGCARWLQQALRENPDPAFARSITHAVVEAIIDCRERGEFLSFYELTGFFVAEFGLETLGPSQRARFQNALNDAAERLAARERAKAVFLKAIQAEAYADQPAGAQARAQAVATAFDIVSAAPPKRIGNDRLLPSGLHGQSVLSVDNSTEHHLLICYRGPETFLTAVRPHRKFSAVLLDGLYEVAVIAPSGAIQPYRGEVELQSSWQKSNYRVEQTGSKQPQFVGHRASSASGDYQLARQPENSGSFQVDPRTGAVRKK